MLYKKLQHTSTYEIIGTYLTNKNDSFLLFDPTNEQNCTELIQTIKPDVIVWCLMSFVNETSLIKNTLSLVLRSLDGQTKFIYISI